MKIMADLDAVHLGLDENEADIAEELQDFDDSFDTRSEASESGSESSDSQPSISSVSSAPSSVGEKRTNKTKKKSGKANNEKKSAPKRAASPGAEVNGKSVDGAKKKRTSDSSQKANEVNTSAESKSKESAKKSHKKSNSAGGVGHNSSNTSCTNITTGASAGNSTSATANTSGSKSDISDAEDSKPTTKPPYDSDSESEDSDSAANIKRNGRKAASKSASPEKKTNSGGSGSNSASKSYDYMTKLNYLFRGTHFFLIKSNNADNIALSKSKNVWATLPQNEANLNQAFKESRNVLLIFSVNESGKFAGFARMAAQSRRDLPHPAWVLPPSISPKALGGIIELDWICRKELSFNCTSHLYNTWNESKPVKIGRDGQEIEPKVGAELCRLFPEDEKIELTPILRKSKETAKMMREKGIRVTYRPPRSLSARGGRGGNSIGYRHGDRRGDGGGPLRHKRSFGGGPHRPYKPSMGMSPGGFKRSSSPYRGGPGGPGGGGSRAGGGDAGLPSWERYMNSAAAEAYVVDYMRTMHGQLPPLPFVPPFAQLPLSAAGPGAMPPSGPPSMYDQLPPPVRYYDGPPLPDYPPPQPIRPPPPSFDKAPSYEDFAAWKNAGLPTLPDAMPPGFPSFGSSSLSASNGGGGGAGPSNSASGGGGSFTSGGGAVGGGGSDAYRSGSNRMNNANMNRTRERGGGGAGRDFRNAGNSMGGSSSRSGSGAGGSAGHDRHFRMGGGGSSERGGGHRNYRDGRR